MQVDAHPTAIDACFPISDLLARLLRLLGCPYRVQDSDLQRTCTRHRHTWHATSADDIVSDAHVAFVIVVDVLNSTGCALGLASARRVG